jgi:excisionase family DNA binding protein
MADAWTVVSTGLNGGRGVPESVSDHPRLFVTLTAPSFGAVHARRKDGSCQPLPRRVCRRRNSISCAHRHNENDLQVGSPLCAQCFDYRRAVLWNAESSQLWNLTFEQIPRAFTSVNEAARVVGVSRSYAYELVTYGLLRSVRLGRRVLIPISAIDVHELLPRHPTVVQ